MANARVASCPTSVQGLQLHPVRGPHPIDARRREPLILQGVAVARALHLQCVMETWKTCIAILAGFVAASAHGVGTHGSRWAQTQAMSGEVSGQGSWSVELQDGMGLWASTKGDRGSLGQYCSDEGACAWILVLAGSNCAEGEQHPVLVNTDRAASHHIIQCIGAVPGIGSALAFVDFDRVDFSIRGASVGASRYRSKRTPSASRISGSTAQ